MSLINCQIFISTYREVGYATWLLSLLITMSITLMSLMPPEIDNIYRKIPCFISNPLWKPFFLNNPLYE